MAEERSVQQKRPRFPRLPQLQVAVRQEPTRAAHAHRDFAARVFDPRGRRPKLRQCEEVDGSGRFKEERLDLRRQELPLPLDDFPQSRDARVAVGHVPLFHVADRVDDPNVSAAACHDAKNLTVLDADGSMICVVAKTIRVLRGCGLCLLTPVLFGIIL